MVLEEELQTTEEYERYWRERRARVFKDYPEILEVILQAKTMAEEEALWRQRWLAKAEGDPEMQAILREATIDLTTPEEDEEDIRICRERAARANGVSYTYEEVMRRLAEEFPEEADELLSGL